jgi:hypothetical protein
MLRWLRREGASTLTTAIFAIAVVGNVSLMLYFRQCRYYAPAIFFSIAVAYLYRFFEDKRIQIFLMVIASIALFASNYLCYLALYVCLALDYLLWGRKRYWLGWRQWLVLLLPQMLLGALIALTWNPVGKHVSMAAYPQGWVEKLKLLWWNLRDGTACEFWAAPLMLAAPIMARLMPERQALRRLLLAGGVYLLLITLISPQIISTSGSADVRYLAPLIPLCIALATLVITIISSERWKVAIPIALLAFGTNVLDGGRHAQFPGKHRLFCSTFCQYVGELLHPPTDPYTQTAQWINAHVSEGESIWVAVDYQTFPLMYHAPGAVYAWLLNPPPAGQFAMLDPIHFKGQLFPDYVLVTGPKLLDAVARTHFGPDMGYVFATKIDCYWKERFRPELIWRQFSPTPTFNHNSDVIYFFKRSDKAGSKSPL